ncbi:MAG: uracil-DNA glycosylase [Thermacetogeniaceae bacterium]
MRWYSVLDSVDDLDSLRALCVSCRECPLRKSATQVVFGRGNPNAVLMFVGEAPGADEDAKGEPFVGKAGQLLDKIIGAAGIDRSEIYITNVCKCRPPGNRTPKDSEADACQPYLTRQIEIIQPRIIVCLGSLATQRLVHPRAKITSVRGKVFEKGGIKIIPTFHPAALLRDPEKKKPVWQDFKVIRTLYDEVVRCAKAG